MNASSGIALRDHFDFSDADKRSTRGLGNLYAFMLQ